MSANSSSFPRYKLAVALLTYNNLDLLKQFVPGILKSIPNDGSCGLFVIDNASTDKSHDYLQTFGDALHIIRIDINRGFTNGYKVGLAQIDADYYCLLSSDVEVGPGWLEPVVSLLDEHSDVAVVQPKIRSWHRRDEFEYAGASGGFMDYQGYPFCRGRIFYTIEKDEGQYDDVCEIFWASGACFFIRSQVYQSMGGLDDDFYAHMEEIDLCWRLKNAGWRVMVCPQSVVYHVGGAVIAYGSPTKVYRNHRNNLIMMMKNLPDGEVVPMLMLRLFMDALAFGNMLLRGQVRSSLSIVSAHWNFFFHLPKWFKKRRLCRKLATQYARTGIADRSIVVEYFLKGRRTFKSLNWQR